MNQDKSFHKATINNQVIQKVSADINGYSIDDKEFKWDLAYLPDGRIHIISGHNNFMAYVIEVDYDRNIYTIQINKQLYKIELKNPFDELLEEMGMKEMVGSMEKSMRAPMPGQIVEILVKEGGQVSQGDPLISLKAMKMENILKATADSIVTRILVKEGDPVEKNQELILFQ